MGKLLSNIYLTKFSMRISYTKYDINPPSQRIKFQLESLFTRLKQEPILMDMIHADNERQQDRNRYININKNNTIIKTHVFHSAYAQCEKNYSFYAARTGQGYIAKFIQDSNCSENVKCCDFLCIRRFGGCSASLNSKCHDTCKLCMLTFSKR
ncbi:hypothetical protein E2986_12112 [Frieseomelitta varia]|uniref:Uncharacterized protein n=1 Tax=Frieseomelitta varia TaxID=561572 RepID=A0A833RR20_9HYME|nr:hypothetical protein E2986_12112 [Frieseomelitta varia]